MNLLDFLFQLFFKRPNKGQPLQTESGNQKHMSPMKQLIHEIRVKTHELMQDLEKFGNNGNKAAGKRVRKTSLELEKLYKDFRKRSVHETPVPEEPKN